VDHESRAFDAHYLLVDSGRANSQRPIHTSLRPAVAKGLNDIAAVAVCFRDYTDLLHLILIIEHILLIVPGLYLPLGLST
jgi:hypothetical protein